MFTQEEVNSIVKDRLARERAKGQTSGATDNSAAELDTEKAQLEADRQKLQDERNAFECERYCKENKTPLTSQGAVKQGRIGLMPMRPKLNGRLAIRGVCSVESAAVR